MYATTYDYDMYSNLTSTVEVAVIGDLIFYKLGRANPWRVCTTCVLRKVNVNAHNLIYRIKHTGYVNSHSYAYLHSTLNEVLSGITSGYSDTVDDLDCFTIQQLDSGWSAVTAQFVTHLW